MGWVSQSVTSICCVCEMSVQRGLRACVSACRLREGAAPFYMHMVVSTHGVSDALHGHSRLLYAHSN
jgi:hypothetical protein